MKISTLVPKSDSFYQDYRFLSFFESHLTVLKEKISSVQDVPDNIAARYVGDFYGLLSYFRVPLDLHYITLRLNGFTNSGDFDGEPLTILMPNQTELNSLQNVYRKVTKQ